MPEAEFIVVPSSYTEKGQYDQEIASAKGLYINMLETCDALYVPKFGLAKDREVLRYIQQHTEKQVIQIHVGEISTMGGCNELFNVVLSESFVTFKDEKIEQSE